METSPPLYERGGHSVGVIDCAYSLLLVQIGEALYVRVWISNFSYHINCVCRGSTSATDAPPPHPLVRSPTTLFLLLLSASMGNVSTALRSVGSMVQRGWNSFCSWISQPHIQKVLIIVAATGVLVAIIVPLIIAIVGFSPAGVVAGSLAAAWQAAVYGGLIPAGCLFALLQSLAMTAGAVCLGLALGGLAALATITYFARDEISRMMTNIGQRLISFIQQFRMWCYA
ncbi:hypothetical protein RSAG8_05384, partial [Rhizoctonia solani AG-8 WAC10335]